MSADETAYLLPAIDPRPRGPATDTRRAVAETPAAAPPPALSISPDFLGRLARILTIIGILTLILYLLTKS